jgi:hypothetical protein
MRYNRTYGITMTSTVKINTSDVEWIKRHPHGLGPVAHGTDIQGRMYFSTPIEVAEVEHVKFAGAAMIRFDIGPDAPRDHNRYAMYPHTYLVG